MKLLLFINFMTYIQIECYVNNDVNFDTLQSVHLIMRHAARASSRGIIEAYKLYPYRDDRWPIADSRFPNGYSELTDIGIKQAINAGKYIKQRYNGFIPKDPKNAILRGTGINRNWDTPALIGKVIWPVNEKRIDSMPPRLFNKPFPLDSLFYAPYCPYLNQGLIDSAELREINAKYKFLYDYVANHTGFPNNIVGIELFFEYLYQTHFNGYSRPDWVTDYWYDLLLLVGMKYHDLKYTGTGLNLKIGMYLKDLKFRMEQVINPDCDVDPWYKNFFLYVSHGFEVFSTLKAMGYVSKMIVQYCSMVIFELHRINGDLKVKVFYINDTIKPPFSGYQMKPLFCPDYDCPYETFISGITSFFPNNWRDECGIPKDFDIYSIMDKWLTISNEYIKFYSAFK